MQHRFTEPTPIASTVEIITIRIASWEIECCAPPPQVGESSTWQLDAEIRGGQLWGTAHAGRPVTRTVRGTVLRLWQVTHSFREDETGVWRAVPGSDVASRIFRSPRWFGEWSDLPNGDRRRRTCVDIELAITRDLTRGSGSVDLVDEGLTG
ncbi:DUF6578 domain-containing protein [Rhodococcus triatomae]|nr:hypothetical protein G419_13691 [Rhodococcus triatomae BKS 15-14]